MPHHGASGLGKIDVPVRASSRPAACRVSPPDVDLWVPLPNVPAGINDSGVVVGGVANGVGLYWRTVPSIPLQILPPKVGWYAPWQGF